MPSPEEKNKEWIKKIYTQNYKLYFFIAKGVTHNDEMAEDAVHNTFISILLNKDKFRDIEPLILKRKILIIIKNKSIDLLRERKKAASYIEESKVLNVENTVINNLETEYIKKESYGHTIKIIEKLDDISKKIFKMKYNQDMTYKEISKELNIPLKTVDTKIRRAKEKIRKII